MRLSVLAILMLLCTLSFGQMNLESVQASQGNAPAMTECNCKVYVAVKQTSKQTKGYVMVFKDALVFRFGDYIKEFYKHPRYDGVYRRGKDVYLVDYNKAGVPYIEVTTKTTYFITDEVYVGEE